MFNLRVFSSVKNCCYTLKVLERRKFILHLQFIFISSHRIAPFHTYFSKFNSNIIDRFSDPMFPRKRLEWKKVYSLFSLLVFIFYVFFFPPNVRLDVLLASKTTAVCLIRSKEKNIFPDYFGFLHSLSRSVSPIRARSECGARWLEVIELDLKTADRNRGALIRGRHRDELRTQERQKERERERERE